jgi:hypothetical protein
METVKLNQKKSRKRFRADRRWHDPLLVLSMSIFNSENLRILSRVPNRETVWH